MSVSDVIYTLKHYINNKDPSAFNNFLLEVEDEYDGVWDYIFKAVYIHACLRKNQPIVDILMERYKELSEVEKIAIRQVFPYGRYLLAK